MNPLDIENKDKKYLDEKELLILYWLFRYKRISTEGSGLFTPNQKFTPIQIPKEPSEIATLEEDISNSYEQSMKRIGSLMGSPFVLSYLLEIGKLFDEKGFIVYGNADYSLVEGGFLSEYIGETMTEYSNDTEENRKNKEEYKVLGKEQKNFLEGVIKGEKFDSIKFSKLAHPPISEYREAILTKKADKDFIEVANKLITEYDGSKWTTKDAEEFLRIYFQHNREQFKRNALTEKTAFYEDAQTRLAKLIFEHTNFGIAIKNTKKLEVFLDKYITSFERDELDGTSKKGLTGTFFSKGLSTPLHTQFFGYKKQRDMLIKHIEGKYNEYQRNDLEIGHPFFEPEYIGDYTDNTVKIVPLSNKDKIKDLFLFVHAMLSLEKEGYLTIEDFSYGPKHLFDLYDRGYLFKVRLSNKRKTNEPVKEIRIDKNPVFDSKNRKLIFAGKEIIIAKKEESDPHKLMKTLFKDVSKTWASDEILEDWGYSFGEDVKKNKAYQAGKAINRTIAQETTIKDFLEITTKTISINPKYIKVRKSL